MAEFVAGIIDRIRTVSLHQWLARLVLALAGTALIVACSLGTDATLAGVMPVGHRDPAGHGRDLARVVRLDRASWRSRIVWWLLGWNGSLWVTVAVAALVGLVHILSALVGGPPHSVIRGAVVRLLGARAPCTCSRPQPSAAVVVALTAVPTARFVAWIAVVVVSVATLVATLVAGMTDEAGQPVEDLLDDEPYEREDLV